MTNESIEVGLSKQLLKGQDVALTNNDLYIYGVFDGIGTDENSLESALIASQSVQASVERNEDKSVQNSPNMLVNAVNEAHQEIVIESRFRPMGTTTASIVKLTKNQNKLFLAWVSIGDSRVYVRNINNPLMMLSRDESSGIYIDNCIGNEKHFHGVSQEGLMEITGGSEIVIVSDGVIGSTESESLKLGDLDNALKSSKTAQEAADELIKISKKADDKTAIVIRTII
ncbi:MAG: protein phosphatase 2C domain-containing protein [Candidatus Saccharibacteria bacterium]